MVNLSQCSLNIYPISDKLCDVTERLFTMTLCTEDHFISHNTYLTIQIYIHGMKNNLRIKDITEIIENVIANCTVCNETGKVASIGNFLTPRSKNSNDLVAIDLAEWTDSKTKSNGVAVLYDKWVFTLLRFHCGRM